MTKIRWRLAEPYEKHPLRCGARRGGRRSRYFCTEMALHQYGRDHSPHHTRGRFGQWLFW